MKVLQILYSGLGGHGSVAFSLQAASDEHRMQNGDHNWENQMVFVGIEPMLSEYQTICRDKNIAHSDVRTTAGKPWKSWLSLFRCLRQHRPDAIILHSVKTILPCWLYARIHKLPLIAVEHQPNVLKKRSEWIASKLVMHLADAVVVLTPDYRNNLEKALGRNWRGDKVSTIPNGIDTSDFSPTNKAPHSRPVRIGMAARFSDKKRQDLVIKALKILVDRNGPDAWHLSLAGEGETHADVFRIAHEANLHDIVDFPGFVGGTDLIEWFNTLDLYVHASEGETLSTSLLQAMAMGLPILGSNVPGIDTLLLERGGCGLLAKEQTAEAFALGLTQLLENQKFSAELAGNARTQALEVYSKEAMFDSYRTVLEELCVRKYSI